MRDLVKVFKALSDSNRLRILKILEVRSLCVCEITDILQLATSTVSKHLSILRDADFIVDKKDGKWVSYSLSHVDDQFINSLLSLTLQQLNDEEIIKEDKEKALKSCRENICGIQ